MLAKFIAIVVLSYLLGAIPFGLIASKLTGNSDVREHGSGKTGVANVLRSVGKRAAGIATVGDVGKGAAAALIAGWFIGNGAASLGGLSLDFQGAQVMAALAAMAGHNWPVYIKFQGGRGVACFFGGLLAMSWPMALVCGGGILLGVSALTRYVSLGSIVGALSSLLIMAVLASLGYQPVEYLIYTGIAAPLIIFQHRDNIQRLKNGTERRLGKIV